MTMIEIKNISFRKATLNGGYRAEDVNSEKEQLQVNFLIWKQIFSYEPLK